MARNDAVFEFATTSLRFGLGATDEVGPELAERQARRVMVVTDGRLVDLPPVAAARRSLTRAGIDHDVFDEVQIEPDIESLRHAIGFAHRGGYDAFLAVGGGSCIDTAKVVDLYATCPVEIETFVNPPVGRGSPIPTPLRPLIAVPTTAGTGSETTGVAVFDSKTAHGKAAIAHRYLRPILGILDPAHLGTAPPSVVAAAGLDTLCHALESFTARPYTQRPRPRHPRDRPIYQGANPVSDVWAVRAVRLVVENLERLYRDRDDGPAREGMSLASAYAGMGLSHAGVHLCHRLGYQVSTLARGYRHPGYPSKRGLVPHGISVAIVAPAVFRFTAPVDTARHCEVAQMLGEDVAAIDRATCGESIARSLVRLFRALDVPNGLSALGFRAADVPELVRAAATHLRFSDLSPRRPNADDLASLFRSSMRLWQES